MLITIFMSQCVYYSLIVTVSYLYQEIFDWELASFSSNALVEQCLKLDKIQKHLANDIFFFWIWLKDDILIR